MFNLVKNHSFITGFIIILIIIILLPFLNLILTPYASIHERNAVAAQRLNLIKQALLNYNEKYNYFPESLNNLVPEFLTNDDIKFKAYYFGFIFKSLALPEGSVIYINVKNNFELVYLFPDYKSGLMINDTESNYHVKLDTSNNTFIIKEKYKIGYIFPLQTTKGEE